MAQQGASKGLWSLEKTEVEIPRWHLPFTAIELEDEAQSENGGLRVLQWVEV